jgi:hypothetical protein
VTSSMVMEVSAMLVDTTTCVPTTRDDRTFITHGQLMAVTRTRER